MISCETLSILTGEGLPRLGASFLENWLSIALLVSMFALFFYIYKQYAVNQP
jgi:hypothetical protein